MSGNPLFTIFSVFYFSTFDINVTHSTWKVNWTCFIYLYLLLFIITWNAWKSRVLKETVLFIIIYCYLLYYIKMSLPLAIR